VRVVKNVARFFLNIKVSHSRITISDVSQSHPSNIFSSKRQTIAVIRRSVWGDKQRKIEGWGGVGVSRERERESRVKFDNEC
jgi:uncharacterized protein YcfL